MGLPTLTGHRILAFITWEKRKLYQIRGELQEVSRLPHYVRPWGIEDDRNDNWVNNPTHTSPSRNFLTITCASWYKPTIGSPRDVSALFLNEVNFSLRFAMLSRRQSSLKLITFEGEPRVLWNGSHPVGRGVHPYHDIHKTRLLTHLSSPIDRNFWKYFQSQPGPAGQIKSELWQVRPQITSWARYWLAFVFVCGAVRPPAMHWREATTHRLVKCFLLYSCADEWWWSWWPGCPSLLIAFCL